MSVPASEASAWVLLAALLRPQGRRGEMLADSFTDFPESLVGRTDLYLAPPEFSGAESSARACSIIGVWLPKGRNEGRVVLEIAAVTSIDDSEGLAGLELIVRPQYRYPLADESTYISDIVGATVFDGEQVVGVVTDLQFATTADGRRRLRDAAPLLVVTSGKDELLIPYVQDLIVRIDPATRQLHMRLPVGLVELQRTNALSSNQTTTQTKPKPASDETEGALKAAGESH